MNAVLKKLSLIILCAAVSLSFYAEVSAEAYKMYRYTDAGGKRRFANSMDDVPPEFRLSASAVMVVKDPPPAENGNGAPKEAAPNGAAVTVLSLTLAATEDGKCGFSGEVKNGMNVKATDVKLHIDIKVKDATKSFDFPVGEGGAMNAGETVKMTRVADVPAAELAGYSYRVTWQSVRVEAPPAKPAQGQPPLQAAAPKEDAATQTPAPAPMKRYRTRNRPAAASPAVEAK